ncbi:hypothetical protein [Streptomyces koyangensis]|uniref:hypothetical protein n=1 Tax=Streptomyces koyangensis TaxID=188770 RepID=UPI003BF565A8
MAQPSQKDVALWDRLHAASAALREAGRDDLANAVDEILVPNGWGRLRRSDPGAGDGAGNFAIYTSPTRHEHILTSARAAGDKLVDRVNEGLRLFLTGEFIPEKPKRAPRGSGARGVNINVRPSETLRLRAKERCEQIAPELGWKPTVSGVALAYLLRIYPLPSIDGLERQ